MPINKFRRGSAVYPCNGCGRRTRDTGDNGSCNLCSQCYDLSGLENEVSDGYRTAEDAREIVVAPLIAEIAAKGGEVTTWIETFGLGAA